MSATQEITYINGALSEERHEEFERALRAERAAEQPAASHLVGGRRSREGPVFERMDPSHPDRVVSRAHEGGRKVINAALVESHKAGQSWRNLSASERAQLIRPLAERLRVRQVQIAATVAMETGKTRLEALGEILEAVAIVEAYCAESENANDWVRPMQSADGVERNVSVLRPYGTFGVIAPFNFPVALFTSMSVGAMLAGNTVVAKPSEDAPRSGDLLIAEIEGLGLPRGVFNAVHGGEETGRALVGSEVDGIAFTGSAAVGRGISRLFQDGPYSRPVVTEMGGKNPAIVTATADLESAAEGVARGAFGMAGQKCSATSRAIVAAEVFDEFLERLLEQTRGLRVGDPGDRKAWLGPLVNPAAVQRYDAAVAEALSDGSIAVGGSRPSRPGYYAEPTVVVGLPREHRLTREELFVPIVTVTAVDSFDDAIEEANAAPYGLCAGIYTQEAGEIDRFLDEMQAGVVFVNRRAGATTGSWPGQQSFCGWKGSGSTGKGGLGPWYLQQFMREQSRTVVPA